MSAAEQGITPPDYSSLISANTIAQSILSEQRDSRLEPEDLRARRFGYNPGPRMAEDPVHSGLQLARIEAGVPILFETGTVSRQNPSVDANDRNPPNIYKDFLAGEGLNAVYHHHAHMGFGELKPLRGLTNAQAGKRFYMVHPPLREFVEAGVIEPCLYKLDVCVTCRLASLTAMEGRVDAALVPLFEVIKERVSVARAFMADEWGKWISEIAETKSSALPVAGLRNLNANHDLFMQHLHQRTPNDQELARIAASSQAQIEVMNKAFEQQTALFAQAMANAQSAQNAEVIAKLQADNELLRKNQEEMMAAIRSGQFVVAPPAAPGDANPTK